MTLPLQCSEESIQLITEEQHAVRVLVQDLSKFFDGAVIHDVATADRLIVIPSHSFLRALHGLGRLAALQQLEDVSLRYAFALRGDH